jgi:hypothetical protein
MLPRQTHHGCRPARSCHGFYNATKKLYHYGVTPAPLPGTPPQRLLILTRKLNISQTGIKQNFLPDLTQMATHPVIMLLEEIPHIK